MIALDINVLVRYLIQDDAIQVKVATDENNHISEVEQGYICRVVLIEIVWVLKRAYGRSRIEIGAALDGLLSAVDLILRRRVILFIVGAVIMFIIVGALFRLHRLGVARRPRADSLGSLRAPREPPLCRISISLAERECQCRRSV